MDKRILGLETEYGISMPLVDSGWLNNGGLIYNDSGGHVEYCTPECTNPRDAMLWDKAGELIVQQHIPNHNGTPIYKNNTDGHGNYYGCHENYLMRRMNFDNLQPLIAFLVTRQIFTGSGNIVGNQFRLSQRSDSIARTIGGSTTGDRGIINKKDESLTDSADFMRLHLILGDANMSEIATYLKLGTTSLVLRLIEDNDSKLRKIPQFYNDDAVQNLHHINKDQSYEWKVKTGDTKKIPAVEIQRRYLDTAQRYRGKDKITDDVLSRWEAVLNALEKDPMTLDRQLDWVIKKRLIDSLRKKYDLKIYDSRILNINLQYHDVDRNTGLFYYLQKNGLVDRLVSDAEIAYAVDTPPRDTRAWCRGNIKKFRHEIDCSCESWKHVKVKKKRDKCEIIIMDPFDSNDELLKKLGIQLPEPPSESEKPNYEIDTGTRKTSLIDAIKGIFTKK